MKRICSLFMIIVATLGSYAQRPGAAVDMLGYSYHLMVNDRNDTVQIKASLFFRKLDASRSVVFDLVSVKNTGTGMKVLSVTSRKQPLPFRHIENKLTIETATRTTGYDTIDIDYAGIPADGLIISRTKYGKRSFFADNWPDRARHWLACVDDPADKAAVEFRVTAPTHYQVVANGVLLEETNIDAQNRLTCWKESIDLPTKVMTVGIADFAVDHLDSTGNIDISSWVYPEDRKKGFYDFALAKEIVPFFEKKIAPFPFRKLANVQSKTTFGGLENAGAIFYSEDLITGERTGESTVAHEIAHQWFGDMATESDFSHLWLSEGFAVFLTMYYMEIRYGKDSSNMLLAGDRQEISAFAKKKLRPVVDSSVKSFMELLNPNSYQKGGWVLQMLRHELGEDVFWKGIQLYYRTYAGKNARTSDFQSIMEQVSGKNLRQFFYQWLYVAGEPQLEVSYRYNTQKKITTVTVVQQQAVLYNLPLEIFLHDKDKNRLPKRVVINVHNRTTSTDIPSDSAPIRVGIDDQVKLLFTGSSSAIRR